MVFVATNQLKEQIGGMVGFGTEKPEALIGGEAQRFNSTYQFKMARTQDILAEDHMGVKRKAGSVHKLTVKRNKLGREGNSQHIELDCYIDGGVDSFSPLVRRLGADYPQIVRKAGAWYYWEADTVYFNYVDEKTGEKIEGELRNKDNYREEDLARNLQGSPDGQEIVRHAFGIPDMPTLEAEEEIAKVNKSKRKKMIDMAASETRSVEDILDNE